MATYKVTTKATIPNQEGTAIPAVSTRLVEAKTKAQAIAHVVADTIDAEVCEISDAVALGKAGVEIEKAGEVAA